MKVVKTELEQQLAPVWVSPSHVQASAQHVLEVGDKFHSVFKLEMRIQRDIVTDLNKYECKHIFLSVTLVGDSLSAVQERRQLSVTRGVTNVGDSYFD